MKYVRFAVRSLKAKPVFFITAVLTLAFGIGFNTLMFSAVYGVLFRPLPFPQGDSLLSLWTENYKLGMSELRTTPADFFDWREQSTTLQEIGGYTASQLHVTLDGVARQMSGATLTIGFFETLGVEAVEGRLLGAEDFTSGAAGAVVLSESFFRRQLGGNTTELGRSLEVAGKPYQIVGVVPDEARLDTRADLWVPMAIDPSQANRQSRFLKVIGRKKPGVDRQEVEAEMALIAQRLAAEHPTTNTQLGIQVLPLRSALLRDNPEKLMTLWGAVSSVLLMICANIVLLMLANNARRKGELAVRFALGASSRQIFDQLLLETLLVTLSGGLFGLMLAGLGLRLARRLVPDPILLEQVHLGGPAVLFALGLSLLLGLLIGGITALRMPQRELCSALTHSARGHNKGRTHRLQKALVSAEVAIAVVLLVATGLMLRSLQQLLTVDPGYDVKAISTVSVVFPRTYPPGSNEMAEYMRHAIETLEALPGVDRVASGILAPLEGTVERSVSAHEVGSPDTDEARVALQAVSDGYFETMGVKITAGRPFTLHERRGVALANETLASQLFGTRGAIGQRIQLTSPLTREPYQLELVGVVEPERLANLAEDPPPALYVPHDLELLPMATLYVRQSNGSATNLGRMMQDALQGIDSDVAVNTPKPMENIFRESLHVESSVELLLGVSGAVALILSLIGVYGVWTLFVSHHQREFGIRLSLGAEPREVRKEVLRKNLKLTFIGLCAGIVLALSMTRLIRHWLFKVQGDDPGTFLAIVLLVTAASLVAGLAPAWRASQVDVMRILRE